MKKKRFSIGIFIVCSAVLFQTPSFSYSLHPYSWANSNATFYTDGNSSLWNSAFIEAMSRWNSHSNFTYHSSSGYWDPCWQGNANGWKFSPTICGENFGDAAAVTLTVYFSYNNSILTTNILFNSALPWNVYSGKMNQYSSQQLIYDFRRIAAHELGHALGLADQYAQAYIGNSIMYGIAHPDMPEVPMADDINGLRAKYGESVNSNVQAFVTRFYQQCLSRNPDSGGLAGWVNALVAGAISGAEVANGFIFSPEFIGRNTTNEQFVTILYRAFFGREPDAGGYAGWVNYLYGGASRQAVLNGFIYSREFENLCANYSITPYFS
jgi:predicted Zn-dependent protease